MRKKIKRFLIKKIEDAFEYILFKKENVNGVGIGPKITNGQVTDKLCVFVTVEKKVELSNLAKKDVIPKRFFGIQTDVFPVGDIELMNAWRDKHRPRKIGASACWEGLTACSEGLPIWDEDEPEDELGYTLANEHCIAANGKAEIGDKVLQPSPLDGGKKGEDDAGEVTYMNFNVHSSNDDNIDMSIFKNLVKHSMSDVVGRSYIPETRYLNEGDLRKKIEGGGRTIGMDVTGRILNVDFTASVRGVEDGEEVIRYYKDCVLALNSDVEGNAIVMGGDSSSIRFVDNRPLLQTFAGSSLVAVFNQTKKSLDYAEKEWGKEFVLTPPEKKHEGYVAVNPEWLTNKKTKVRLNLRESPGVGGNLIKTLPKGTRIETDLDYSDGYFWIKVREK